MLLFSMLAMAAQAASAPQPSTRQDAPRETKVMCRMVHEAASRIPIRVCKTVADWELMERETQDSLRSSRNQRTTGGPTG